MLDYFFSLLLPRTGPYCIWFKKLDEAHKGSHRWYDNIADMTRYVRACETDRNVYYALGTFSERRRKTEFAKQYRTLFVDLDCGVGKDGAMRDYTTQEEGLKALAQFCREYRLPRPLLVDSGWGIHAYWPLVNEIDPAQWQSLQRILKHLAVVQGLRIDVNALTKATQITRPIESFNVRETEHRMVSLIGEYVRPQDEALIAHLHKLAKDYEYVPQPIASKQMAQADQSKYDLHMDWPPANGHEIEKRCGQIAFALRNPNDVSYDQWFRLLGVAKFCDDPEETAKRWSQGYNNYDEGATLAKLHSWNSGPTLCDTLRETGQSNVCAVCPHREHIKTPVQIAAKLTEAPDDNEIQLKNYKRTRENGIVRTLPDNSVELISPYDVVITEMFWDDAQAVEHVAIEWHGLHAQDTKLRRAVLPWYTLAPGYGNLTDTFNRLGITTVRGKLEAFDLARYLSEYKRELERRRMRPTFYDSMGWKEECTAFVLGTTIYHLRDGEIHVDNVSHTKHMHSDMLEGVSAKGDLEQWKKITTMLADPDLRAHAFVMLCGFGAPLLELTGYSGVMLNMVGSSGAGKTTLGSAVLSIYGNPRLLQVKSNATQNSIYSYFAGINNLPGYLDEVTNLSPEVLSELCYNLSTGEERRRLNADGSPKASKRWSTIAISSSNNSISDKLLLFRTSPEAELLRLFELQVPRSKLFEEENLGVKMHAIMRDNYGVAGPEYCQWLLHNVAAVRDVLSNAEEMFKKLYDFTFLGPERFWMQLFACAHVGGVIANKLGLSDIDVKACVTQALEQLRLHRAAVDIATTNAIDLISQYTLQYYNSISVIQYNPSHSLFTTLRESRGMLQGLIEIHPNGDKFLYLDHRTFQRWCTERGEVFKSVRTELKRLGVVAAEKTAKKLDPNPSGLATQCLKLDLTHHAFRETNELIIKHLEQAND